MCVCRRRGSAKPPPPRRAGSRDPQEPPPPPALRAELNPSVCCLTGGAAQAPLPGVSYGRYSAFSGPTPARQCPGFPQLRLQGDCAPRRRSGLDLRFHARRLRTPAPAWAQPSLPAQPGPAPNHLHSLQGGGSPPQKSCRGSSFPVAPVSPPLPGRCRGLRLTGRQSSLGSPQLTPP